MKRASLLSATGSWFATRSMKTIHIALSVSDIAASVADYSARLGHDPEVVVPDQYALWRTPHVNLSIRKVPAGSGALRHLGWEDDASAAFTSDTDINGIVWERFSAEAQAKEIHETWPEVEYTAR